MWLSLRAFIALLSLLAVSKSEGKSMLTSLKKESD